MWNANKTKLNILILSLTRAKIKRENRVEVLRKLMAKGKISRNPAFPTASPRSSLAKVKFSYLSHILSGRSDASNEAKVMNWVEKRKEI